MAARAYTANEIVELIALACRRAGIPDHDAKLAATTATEMIAVRFGGGRLYIPRHQLAHQTRRDAIVTAVEAGEDVGAIAKTYGVKPKRIREIYNQGRRAVA